jgi:glycosyltransferase involved in cell wall biosynthesis
VAEIRELIAEHDLEERVELMGELTNETLAAWYRQADLFVLPSQHEGYGMALGEALAYGLPIVSTTAGAIPDTVPPGAGLLTPPGDSQALAAALRLLLTDSWRRQQLAAAARQAGRQLPAWPETAARFAAALTIP